MQSILKFMQGDIFVRALVRKLNVPLETITNMFADFFCCLFSIPQVTGLLFIRRTYFANSPQSYLIHHPTCCRSRSQWASVLSSHGWTLLSCDGTSPSPVRPTAGWHALGTAVPLGPSRHQNPRWANSPSVGGPGQDSREREPGVESATARTLPARPVWSYRLGGGGEHIKAVT